MVRAIMHGCNGAMGQVISGIAAKDEEISIVAGIDMRTRCRKMIIRFLRL